MKGQNFQQGVALLITILVMGVILAISSSLLSVTLKQYQISGIALASETAFHAANAGIECARYYDQHISGAVPINAFEIPNANDASVNCMGISGNNSIGVNTADSGDEQEFQFEWRLSANHDYLCTEISVFKFYEDPSADGNTTGPDMSSADVSRTCSEGIICTVIQSRGYNADCDSLTNSRTVERELILVY